jgi:hypothetical protein
MATEVIDFKAHNSNEGVELTEEFIKGKINNLSEEDEDDDSIILDMSDISELAGAMAMIKAGLNKISEITQTDVSDEVVNDIASKIP